MKLRVDRLCLVATPILLIGGCIWMGTRNIKTVESVDFTTNNDKTNPANLVTSTVNYAIVTTNTYPTITTTTTKPLFRTYEEPLAVSVSYTTTDTNYYDNWDMYGTEMHTYYGEYIEVDEALLKYIYKECNNYNVPYELALATCYVESNFTADINNEGLNMDGSIDYGMMGLNGNYLYDNCINYNGSIPIDPYNPYENVHIGIQILRDNLDYWGDSIWDASNSYNLGIGGWENIKYYGSGYWYYADEIFAYMNLLYNEYIG